MCLSNIISIGGNMRAVITTVLELLGIAGCVTAVALSPVPWVAFAVAGVGLILVSRGLTGGASE